MHMNYDHGCVKLGVLCSGSDGDPLPQRNHVRWLSLLRFFFFFLIGSYRKWN